MSPGSLGGAFWIKHKYFSHLRKVEGGELFGGKGKGKGGGRGEEKEIEESKSKIKICLSGKTHISVITSSYCCLFP